MTRFGWLNVNKPPGLTSRQVVDRVARLVRPAKVGHAGTLDPLASGVLVVAVGSATRLIEYVQRMPKRYTGTFLLGRSSPTEDVEGEVVELDAPPRPSVDELQRAAGQFVGEILQRPPVYSALKRQGRRSYDLARRGQPVELAPRPIVVYGLKLLRYDYPEMQLEIECGGGTYVRSLGRDIAESLGTAAVMSALIRTAIGTFTLDGAIRPDELSTEQIDEQLLPPQHALADLPSLRVTPDEARALQQGRTIHPDPASSATGPELVVFDQAERLIALAAPQPDGSLRSIRNFPLAE